MTLEYRSVFPSVVGVVREMRMAGQTLVTALTFLSELVIEELRAEKLNNQT
jgi:hypothetical protein